MILYLDTSCIAKIFLDEADSENVRRAVGQAEALATSVLSYVEMRSLVARRRRQKLLSAKEAKRIIDVFDADWAHYGKIPIDSDVLSLAGQLVGRRALRTLDALHLSSALRVQDQVQEPIVFLCADRQLEDSARRERLRTSV